MDTPRPTMMAPPIERLLERVDSKFTLVTLTAQRARQLTSYFGQLGVGLGAIIPPLVASQSTKPVSIALDEIDEGRIVAIYRRDLVPVEDEAATSAAATADLTP
jgi:DNA-directed RNA polymerase subunit omega